MAHLLRGKQAGVQKDLSAGLNPEFFNLNDVARYGINSQISVLAYDPVQSLLAVGTNESSYGSGQIYVFGQKRVCVTLNLPRKASVKILQFCADKIISVDSKNELAIFSLETNSLVTSYAPPGFVTALLTDPSIDWAFLGLQNGDVIAYDIDRDMLSPFKIPNIWRERSPKARILPVVTLALHPKDIGTLLIGYTEGAAVFSFKQSKAISFFQYELPRGAPGGDSDPTSVNNVRYPRLTQALWHPSGTFILTGHEDSSLVIWDPKDGRIIMARTLQDANVNVPGAGVSNYGGTKGTFSLKEPLFRVAWCCKQNTDDTGILIAGGTPTTMPTKGLTFLELGITPSYATSSWQILSDHFAAPKRQRILPTPPNAEVVDFCLIPRASPYFAGACDPLLVLALLSSGEVVTLGFPSGQPVSPTNQLHLSLTLVHPFVHRIDLAPVTRERWLGMTETRQPSVSFLTGGAEANHPRNRYQHRNIVQTAHADGVLRIWDAGHADEIENEDLLEVDIAVVLRRLDDLEVSRMSMSGATGELAVGLKTGEMVVFRWGINKNFGRQAPSHHMSAGGHTEGMVDVQDRGDPALKEGLLPLTLLSSKNGAVTALKLSDVGFIGVGYEGGSIAVVDLRGPAVIYNAGLSDLLKHNKRSSFRKSGNQDHNKREWPTVLEFSVMTLDGDDYSSILFLVGTSLGRIATFKLLPQQTGGYSVQFVGFTTLDDQIISLCPLNTNTGAGAYASQTAVGGLREGKKTPGVLLAVTQTAAKIFKPAAAKGAHKTWDDFLCEAAAVTENPEGSHALVGIFNDGFARAFTIPGLKETGMVELKVVLDPARMKDAIITETGDILGWTGPSELALINVWGPGRKLQSSRDKLFNPDLPVPARPTISNIQWIAGTQYVSPADMDVLIGGPDRPLSKREIEEKRQIGRAGPANPQDEGWAAYMQRQLNERTEKLNIVGDSMERLEEQSSSFAGEMGKFVNQQKKKAILGGITGKWF